MAHIFEDMFTKIKVPVDFVADIKARELAQRVTRGFVCPHSSYAITSERQLWRAVHEHPQMEPKVIANPCFQAAVALLK